MSNEKEYSNQCQVYKIDCIVCMKEYLFHKVQFQYSNLRVTAIQYPEYHERFTQKFT